MITLIGSVFAIAPGSLPEATGMVAASSVGMVLGVALLAALLLLVAMADHEK